jgi:hypothetical protein
MATSGVRGRLKCRERDLFATVFEEKVAEVIAAPVAANLDMRSLNHFIVEFLASVILVYSAIYVPEDGNDYMKQYVSAISIFIVMLTVKDKLYFCPDGTPMATAVLAASGAYTDKEKKTDFWDIGVRLLGQLVGWAVVCFVFVGYNKQLFAKGVPEYKYSKGTDGAHEEFGSWFMVGNEFIATFIECVAISFMIMPLLNSYAATENANGFQSKQEAMPPNNKDLWFASVSLAVLHYVLERLFRATMNPFMYGMHCYVTGAVKTELITTIMVAQLLALSLACLNCYFLLPSQRVFDRIRSTAVPP